LVYYHFLEQSFNSPFTEPFNATFVEINKDDSDQVTYKFLDKQNYEAVEIQFSDYNEEKECTRFV
jgi:hypothetical protein